MPKLKGPLFSIGASGNLGGALSYQKHNMGQGVHSRPFRKKVSTSAQLIVRSWFKKAFYVWRNNVTGFGYYISAYCTGLTPTQKNLWIRSSVIERMTGINLYIKSWQARSVATLPQYQLPDKTGFCLADEWLADNLICDGKFILGGT